MVDKIYSQYFRGDSASCTPVKIAPENIMSMQQRFPITMSSYGHGEGTPHFTKDGIFERTSNNFYITNYRDFNRNGRALGPDDYFHFGKWIQATTNRPSSSFNYVALPQRTSESGATESFGEKLLKLHENDPQTPTYIHTFYLQGLRNNEAGKKLSELENSRQRLTRHYGTDIAHALAEKAVKSGKLIEDIGYIASGFVPENEEILYGVWRTKFDKKIMLTAAEDVYERISQTARALGIPTEDYIRAIALAEEQEHINRRSFDKHRDLVSEEYDTKDSVFHEFLELLKGAEGGDPRNPKYENRRALLRKLAAIKMHDRDTTKERYTEKGTSSKKLYLKDKAASEDDTDGYNSLDEISEEDTKESRMSKLEQIAEKGNAKEAPKEEAPAEAEMQEAA